MLEHPVDVNLAFDAKRRKRWSQWMMRRCNAPQRCGASRTPRASTLPEVGAALRLVYMAAESAGRGRPHPGVGRIGPRLGRNCRGKCGDACGAGTPQ